MTPHSVPREPATVVQAAQAPRRPVIVGGIEQHDERTPIERLWLTPRRTKYLIELLDGPRTTNEALQYLARVGLVQRNERGEYSLTEPRGRELAEWIRERKPPLRGKGY